jgi:putative two-component system response regulator
MSRVVVVDDYEPTLRMYAAAIEKLLGGEVVTFSDPLQALHYVNGMAPTLCVIDYNMPDMDGVSFVERLRTTPGRERTPVIMLTGMEDRDLKARAIHAGVSVFLNKPVTAEEFAGHVRRLVKTQSDDSLRAEEVRELRERVDGAERRLQARDRELLQALFRSMEVRDPQTAAKMKRAAEVAVLLAIEGRCSARDVQILREAAFVYDLGKLAIPEKILTSSAMLSPQSKAAIERHAEAGAEILAVADSPLFAAAQTLARSHHERWDGLGYPQKLKGEAIPLSARIMAVADAFVALTHPRADRPAMTVGHALDQLKRESGTHFDPSVVTAFERIKDKLPR